MASLVIQALMGESLDLNRVMNVLGKFQENWVPLYLWGRRLCGEDCKEGRPLWLRCDLALQSRSSRSEEKSEAIAVSVW